MKSGRARFPRGEGEAKLSYILLHAITAGKDEIFWRVFFFEIPLVTVIVRKGSRNRVGKWDTWLSPVWMSDRKKVQRIWSLVFFLCI